eukprot:763492-Pelagomonas_calceolata.AAC.1
MEHNHNDLCPDRACLRYHSLQRRACTRTESRQGLLDEPQFAQQVTLLASNHPIGCTAPTWDDFYLP